ncbi:MAG: methylmalonyl-CoA epimerase [Dehalococcoidia bacterium]|nr:methylmalonyl-CoA epimerase [Dehalococcoidia bacterium]
MITGLHHVALAVRDMDETAAFYSTTFGLPGLEVTETLPDQGVRAGFISLGNARIELLQPLRPDSTVGRFLERHGEGLHHLCLETDDVTAELARIGGQGVTLIDQAPRHGLDGLIGFLHPKSTGSVLIELVQVNGEGGAIAVIQDGRVLRVLIAKPGLDGHDRGAKVVARALRDAGMEVIYTGIRQTPDMIAEAALQEDVDAVGLSILSGAHMELCPRVIQLLREKGMGDLPVFIGGIIPEEDIAPLKVAGIQAVFGPGTSTSTIVDFVRGLPVVQQ